MGQGWRRALVAGVGLALALTGCARATPAPVLPTDGSAATDAAGVTTSTIEARALAREAAEWGATLVTTQRTWTGLAALTGGTNRFVTSGRLITPADRLVPAPNVDTLYGAVVLDLEDGPLTITVPAVAPDRFQALQIIDQWTEVPLYAGSRDPGNAGGTYVLRRAADGASRSTPTDGGAAVDLGTDQGVALFRVEVTGPEDVAAAQRVLAGIRVSATPGPATTITVAPSRGRPADALTPPVLGFFDELDASLVDNPPAPNEQARLARYARIGVGPGVVTSEIVRDPRIRGAMLEGLVEARVAIAQVSLPTVNGWQIAREGIGSYDGATSSGALFRSRIATCCWGAPPPADAIYPLATVDATGATLDSARRYTLTFPPGGTPPVTAPGFWSVTLYDRAFFLAANPLARYALGDRSGLRPAADGSLTLYLQRDDPGGERTATWLPTPSAGPFRLMLRAYIPGTALVDGSWTPPPVVPVP